MLHELKVCGEKDSEKKTAHNDVTCRKWQVTYWKKLMGLAT